MSRLIPDRWRTKHSNKRESFWERESEYMSMIARNGDLEKMPDDQQVGK